MIAISKETLANILTDPDPNVRQELARLLLTDRNDADIGGLAVEKLTGMPSPLVGQVFADKKYVVWNKSKTLGIITTDWQLAYEARKGSETNCYFEDIGDPCHTAKGFCEDTGEENCTMEQINGLITSPADKPVL